MRPVRNRLADAGVQVVPLTGHIHISDNVAKDYNADLTRVLYT